MCLGDIAIAKKSRHEFVTVPAGQATTLTGSIGGPTLYRIGVVSGQFLCSVRSRDGNGNLIELPFEGYLDSANGIASQTWGPEILLPIAGDLTLQNAGGLGVTFVLYFLNAEHFTKAGEL